MGMKWGINDIRELSFASPVQAADHVLFQPGCQRKLSCCCRLTNRLDKDGNLISEEQVDDGLDMGPPPRLTHLQKHVDQEDDILIMPAYAELGESGVSVTLFDGRSTQACWMWHC